ncbi:MAG: VOC family protein [Clostridium sp.]|nr:VOC family protein [Clostridium sp.]
MKILHAMIRVKDIEKSMKFYCELLGLHKTHEIKGEDYTLHFLGDGVGSFEIELTENFETPQNGYENGNAFGHFAFETEDMDEFDKKFKAFGGEYLYEPYIMEEAKSKIAFIKDPDGNEIEIIQPL